ncbi:MAG: murein biosynthesis integral membrane protein MurJ [Alphaproteobacteria bacterium]|nr:murein biosynthesis integral membrane protein MurJ [Alphaproteobacteria bacterium]
MALIKSILTVGGGTAISRVLGFVRDILIARFLGASMMADAFFVALRFPNLFRSLFAEGTLNVAFVPLLSGELHEKGPKHARVFARSVFSFLFYVLLIFTVVMEILMPNLMFLFAPGFEDIAGKLTLTTTLSRITFPFLLCVSLVSLFAGMLNAVGKFWAAAFTPTILNAVMILSLFVITPFINNPYAPAYALSYGVLIAGLIEFCFLLWHVRKAGLAIGLINPIRALCHVSAGVKTLLRKMAPGVLGSGVYQINLFFDTLLVSFVGAGAISWLNYAHHLFQLPIGIIGTAIGTALLPVLSRHIKMRELEQATTQLNRALEISLAMSTASMVGLMCLAEPIVRILFERGAFTSDDSLHTALALIVFAIGLPAYMLTKTVSPFFYARGDTSTPVKIAVIGVILNAVLAIILMQFWGYIGIALATGIVVWINAGQYIVRLYLKGDVCLDKLARYRLPRILVSAVIMGVFLNISQMILTYYFPHWRTQSSVFSGIVLFGLIGMAVCVYGCSIILTKSVVWQDVKSLLRRSKSDK